MGRARHLGAAVAVLALLMVPSVAHAAPEGPPLTVAKSKLAAALTCTPDVVGAKRDPVLLTPAFSTDQTSYGWNYIPRFRKTGVPFCSISVQDEGYGDLQATSEYVVYAVRAMAAASGRKVVVFGHQHGALDELWALKFWPDVARHVSDLVSLATPYNGTTASADLCSASCAAATRQISKGSAFLSALGRAPLPRGPAYTSIASTTDALITPEPEASRLAGASNLTVQDICPGRQVSHFEILADAVAYALVSDALDHEGAANSTRIPRGVCAQRLQPDADPVTLSLADAFLPIFAARNVSDGVREEPPTRAYAARRAPALAVAPKAARISRSGRLAVRVRCQSVGVTACRVKVSLKTAGKRRAGSRLATVESAGTRVVRVHVPKMVRRALRTRGTLRLKLTLTATDALANRGTLTRRLMARKRR